MTFRIKIDKILKAKSLKLYELEDLVGFGRSTIQKKYNQDKELSKVYLKTFLDKLGVRSQWWESGEGEIFLENITQVNESDGRSLYVKKPNARPVVVDHIEVRLVEQRAQAGYLRGYKDPEYMETLPVMYVSREAATGGKFLCFQLEGDSMNDGTVRSFLPNDIVLCRELYRDYWKSKIKNIGKPWIIVHNGGFTFKEIIHHDVEKGLITCHSWNPANLPEYEDFVLDLREVEQLWYYKRLVERK